MTAVTSKVTSGASLAPQGYAEQPSPADQDSLPSGLDAIGDARNSCCVRARLPPAAARMGRGRGRDKAAGRGPHLSSQKVQGECSGTPPGSGRSADRALPRGSLAPGGAAAGGSAMFSAGQAADKRTGAPSSLPAPAPPHPAPPRAPPRPASALPQFNKGRAGAPSRAPQGEGQRNSHPASPAAGAKDRWKVRPTDQCGWSLRLQQCQRGRRGGLTYQQSEGWMGRLADGWRRDGGMEGQMEAQLDVTDRWREDQWPNR